MVTVSVEEVVAVGVLETGMGVSLTGRKGVLVGLPSEDTVPLVEITMGVAQPLKNAATRNMHTDNRLILMLVLNLQLHLPNGFQ
jgi:hypothetical protein